MKNAILPEHLAENPYVAAGIFLAGVLLGILLTVLVRRTIRKIQMRDAQENEHITLYRGKAKDFLMLCTVNGMMYVIFYYIYGSGSIGEMILYCACFTLLLALGVIDWNTYEIPFGINVCIFIIGLMELGLDSNNWGLHIIGFFAVSGFLCLLYWWSGGSWIGGGDIKLMAVAGLFLGWKLILVAFVVGCVLGSIIHLAIMAIQKDREHMLAFGPYLSLGIAISMIWGEQLASWYLSLLKI